MAAEMGRTVMAVPGDVGRATSEGCNVLIRDGATPVLDPDDFAAAVGLVLGPPRAAAARGKGRDPLVAALGPVGCSLEEAATVWEMDAAGAAASAARLEVAGLIRREDGILVPVDR
jgi:DNA processing protein